MNDQDEVAEGGEEYETTRLPPIDPALVGLDVDEDKHLWDLL